jgi:hypothetical protein
MSLRACTDEMGQGCEDMSKKQSIEERLLALESEIDSAPKAGELESLVEDKITKLLPEIVKRVRDEL